MSDDYNPPEILVALIVEDQADALGIKRELLEQHGFTVLGARNREQALAEDAAVPSIDLVVTDVNLDPSSPLDKSGLDLAREIRESESGVPIVGYSALFAEDAFPETELESFDRYHPKGTSSPVEVLENVREMQRLARRHRRRRVAKASERIDEYSRTGALHNLYSVSTWVNHVITVKYFGGLHYVWCTTDFSSSGSQATPPTSCPREIYQALKEEVRKGDRHSSKIRENRDGIVRGAEIRRDLGEITNRVVNEVKKVVQLTEIHDFQTVDLRNPIQASGGPS